MELFLHTKNEMIRIVNGDQTFETTPSAFSALVPEYTGLPVGAYWRYWTPGYHVICTGATVSNDEFDAQPYIDNIAAYLGTQLVCYALVTLTPDFLCVEDVNAYISFSGQIVAAPDANAPVVPVSGAWGIILRNSVNPTAVDMIHVTIVDGYIDPVRAYRYVEGLPLGLWFVNDADFKQIPYEGQLYRPRLLQPVEFSLFRTAAEVV